jgi:hypothetical protein
VIILVLIVAFKKGNWNEPDPYWCWIVHQHLAAQLVSEYLWLWMAGFGSILFYVPVFLILKGWITWNWDCGNNNKNSINSYDTGEEITQHEKDERTCTVDPVTLTLTHKDNTPPSSINENEETLEHPSTPPHLPTSYTLHILLYPIAYTILVLPISLARWRTGFSSTNHTMPTQFIFLTQTIFQLTGFINAFLLLYVRRSVSLLRPPEKDVDVENILDDDDDDDDAIIPPASSGHPDVPLEVGDNVYAFEQYTLRGNETSGIWYRG